MPPGAGASENHPPTPWVCVGLQLASGYREASTRTYPLQRHSSNPSTVCTVGTSRCVHSPWQGWGRGWGHPQVWPAQDVRVGGECGGLCQCFELCCIRNGFKFTHCVSNASKQLAVFSIVGFFLFWGSSPREVYGHFMVQTMVVSAAAMCLVLHLF